MKLEAFFIEEKIYGLLAEKFQEEAFQDCFLVELNLHRGNKLEVFIDCDSGMTLEKCQRISRYLESHLDEQAWLGDNYVLEVSSPDLGRPLKLKRQYAKNIGRKLAVTRQSGEVVNGVLKAAGEDSITLEETVVRKEGKSKKKEQVQTEIPFDDIKKAMVTISFQG
ncbi:MAG: hypothetical protein RI973_648 [Bacteroidota bacterium]